ncbi:hypothetical protein SADUNF_Sadunf06G0059100 [Salix dunnii]|uniref:Uncharacterized protein n=1 Tax=Salix dunnii TaxID=1413687 RepID=A0A835K5Q0_9ROSI|nr:hypothetical protein SADUNF_Sadunf06G0059100 [Salix dunnii]
MIQPFSCKTNGSDHIIFTNCVSYRRICCSHIIKSRYRHIQMQSHPEETLRKVKKEADSCTDSCYPGHLQSTLQEPIQVSSSNEDDSHDTGDIDDQSIEDSSKQLVLYDPVANGTGQIEPIPQPIQYQHPFGRYSDPNVPSRVLPSVGAFTIQCAMCFKWRLIPTKEKYEELREHILEEPFFCETARAWRPDISCDDPTDITQDGSRLWAIDKPNIAQPPPGWQRLLRIRGEGSTKFADVYYQSPSGKRLRSMVEVQKYLSEHPEYMTYGVTLSQFSFQIPKPLQENYVRKRRPHISASCDDTRHLQHSEGIKLSAAILFLLFQWILESGPKNCEDCILWSTHEPPQPNSGWIDSAFRSSGFFVVLEYENCLKWIGDFTELQLGKPALLPPPSSSIQSSASLPFDRPVKKKARTQSKQSHRTTNPVCNQDGAKVEVLDQNGNSGSDL